MKIRICTFRTFIHSQLYFIYFVIWPKIDSNIAYVTFYLISYGYSDFDYGYNEVKSRQTVAPINSVFSQVAAFVSSGKYLFLINRQ